MAGPLTAVRAAREAAFSVPTNRRARVNSFTHKHSSQMAIRFFNILLSFLVVTAMVFLTACATNTDDATNSADTEKHGTMEQQMDSMQNEQGPGLQPRDTVTNTGP